MTLGTTGPWGLGRTCSPHSQEDFRVAFQEGKERPRVAESAMSRDCLGLSNGGAFSLSYKMVSSVHLWETLIRPSNSAMRKESQI